MAGNPRLLDADRFPRAEEEPAPWYRTYPPLLLLCAALVTAVLFLPSALNIPQSNPSTTLEYAPVPPDDSQSPPVNGNLLALGSARSPSVGGARPPLPPPPPPPSGGAGARPAQKRCVGAPPRQTEDPASPPCVPYFQGDNFGATYQGVTANEIRVLVYIDTGTYGTSAGGREITPAAGTYVDIDEPRRPNCGPGPQNSDPKQCDEINVRILKAFTRYFNDRYQTYGRRVHYWAFFSGAASAAARETDAAENIDRLKPFAVVDTASLRGNNEAYDTAMTQRGVLVFASAQGSLPAAFYRKHAPLAWGFFPDVEHWSRQYASYVCTKVAPYPVRRYGNPPGAAPPNGSKRRIGLWHTTDPAQPGLQLFAQLVKKELRACGVRWETEATFSRSGFAIDGQDDGRDAAQGVARFQSAQVSTVLHLGGAETRFSAAAESVRYFPEIVVAGNLFSDNNLIGQNQSQGVWQNAWATTFQVRMNRLEDSPGYKAFREGNPSGDDLAGFYARELYPDHFMLFSAIQVAGPRLTKSSVDQGYHAIPGHASSDPYSPALFFDPGDYSFVKDAAEQWWDPQGRAPAGAATTTRPGCWRMTRGGARSLAGAWPKGDDVFRRQDDPCTGYDGTIAFRPPNI